MRILLVEDDKSTAQSIELTLKSEGFIVDLAELGEDGLEIGKIYDYDLIILDLMLPDIDGYEVLRRFRDARVDTPILILSGLSEMENKVKGLGIGADDYLTKPFDLEILEARMNALIRRYHGKVASCELSFGSLKIDQKTRKAYRNDKLLALNPTTYTILEMLCSKAPELVTRQEIARKLWDEEEPNNDVLRSHIYQLRNQLDKPFSVPMLTTIPKIGFRLENV